MDDPIWITAELALSIHQRQLAEHGGLAGVRDQNMLESALARPRQQFAYSEPTPGIPALAAAYAYGIARNHPFIDGNKRTAYVVCRTFLVLNGFDFTAGRDERYLNILRLAAGELSQEAFTSWVEKNSSSG
ncbi:MAG TPA: type II toxin-antitoxin system death-on-curing family toxin [Tepidisphaeraceae bacterium]|jgi:death-on-curing protein|nr:type II toxin-antitoxin system death-on-curing family toxin [Tepidisphaeraceae bacterium]